MHKTQSRYRWSISKSTLRLTCHFWSTSRFNVSCCLQCHHACRGVSHENLSYCCFHFSLGQRIFFPDTSPIANGSQAHKEKQSVLLGVNGSTENRNQTQVLSCAWLGPNH